MKIKSHLIFIAIVVCLFAGCAGVPKNEVRTMEQQVVDQQVYEPYKMKNTIEGYQEFIAKYPGSQFVGDARRKMYRLKYDEYLLKDTTLGYREFIQNNPDNPHAKDALRKIEGLEFRRYEKEDSIKGYKEFVAQYPDSYFVADAKLRIQELEFRQLDEKLRAKYGFDLLKYRLELRRLKRDLTLSGKNDLANFKCDAQMKTHKGKTYFQTNLIYNNDFKGLALFSDGNGEDVFDAVVFEALLHLQSQFRHNGEVDGFSFNLSVSSSGLYQPASAKSETYFPVTSVSEFCQNLIDKKTLKEESFVIYPAEIVVVEKQEPAPQPTSSVFSEVSAGLTASDGAFTDAILVMWDPADRWVPSASVDGYHIYRAEGFNGNYEPVSGILKGTIYYDKDIQVGKSYYYKVRGYNAGKTVSSFSNAAPGKTASGGIKGPVIIQGAPLMEGTYVFKPDKRANPIYQFEKNGTCIEFSYQSRLKGRWQYEGDFLVIKTGIEDYSYTVKMVERWENAFATHNGRRFHRMGLKQVRQSDLEAMKFSGKGRIQVDGTGLAKRNDTIQVEVTVVLDKAGVWHTTFTYGQESSKTTTPASQVELEVVEFNGNYFLSMSEKGPGYFRE